MSNANYSIVESPDHFKELLSADLKRISIINFWTPWAEPCHEMNKVVEELAKKYPAALFLQVCKSNKSNLYCISCKVSTNQVEAEEQSDIAESFDISSVPSFMILQVCASIRLRNPFSLNFPVKHRVILSWVA